MLEGIGLFTILGTLGTITFGAVTPLDCYIGLSSGTDSGVITIEKPVGHLGCQYDFDTVRLFAEHISSPATDRDHPGINHIGAKFLMPIDDLKLYAGASYIAIDGKQYTGTPVLSMVGTELGDGPIRFYSEYIMPIDKPADGMAVGGVKFVF